MTMAEVRETAFHYYSVSAPALLTPPAHIIRICLTKTNWKEFMEIGVTSGSSADFCFEGCRLGVI